MNQPEIRLRSRPIGEPTTAKLRNRPTAPVPQSGEGEGPAPDDSILPRPLQALGA